MIRTATGLAAVAGLAVALSACAGEMPFGPEPEPVYSSATYVPGASAIICYRTLAAPDCYATPQPGPPNRVIAAYDELYPPPPPDEATRVPVEVVPTTGGGVPVIEHTPQGPRPILRPEG